MAFNGGKSQVQSQTLLEGGDYPFINMMKTMQSWTYISPQLPVVPIDLDTDGYPKVINNSGVSNIIFLPPSKLGPGTTWVMDWDGRGQAGIYNNSGGSTNITNGATFSNVGGAASNYVEFNLPTSEDGQCTIYINAVGTAGSDYVHNMRVYLLSEKTRINAGEIFGQDFLNVLTTANPGVIRFLNWQNTNYSAVSTYATEKPESYYSYYADEYRGSLLVTSGIGGTGDNFTGTFGTGPPVDKMTLLYPPNHDSVGTNWMFNLNSTGYVPIYTMERAFYQVPYRNLSNGSLCVLVYDADAGVWFKQGGYSGNQSGINSGPPPSICVKLCMKVGAHPYFLVPTFAFDPLTDWVTSVDNYIQANAPSWMIPRYETPNENWNTQFFANNYSSIKSFASWGSGYNAPMDWAGRGASLLGQAIYTNRGNDKTKTQVIVGIQSSSFTGASNSNAKMNTVRAKGFMVGAFTNGIGQCHDVRGNTTLAVNDPVTIVPRMKTR